jgi:predicted dehydrogenase
MKRFALVGTGGRGFSFMEAVVSTYRQTSQLVALCDCNPGRAGMFAAWCGRHDVNPAVYAESDFERMLSETHPDTLIVTTPCATHADYICRAMEAGVDVISEKAMATDEDKVRRVLETRRRTGRMLRVTFNTAMPHRRRRLNIS